jgi:Fe-S-cluster containining protein
MAKKNVCSECINHSGGCCVGVRFNVHSNEIKPFLNAMESGKIPIGHKLIQDKDDKNTYLYDSGSDNRCMFLGEKNQCTIYFERPLICRLYPILWKKDNYFVDLICPLVHVIPLREIATWPNKNKESLKDMPELDFDGRSRQYVNLKSLHKMNDALEILRDSEVGL